MCRSYRGWWLHLSIARIQSAVSLSWRVCLVYIFKLVLKYAAHCDFAHSFYLKQLNLTRTCIEIMSSIQFQLLKKMNYNFHGPSKRASFNSVHLLTTHHNLEWLTLAYKNQWGNIFPRLVAINHLLQSVHLSVIIRDS